MELRKEELLKVSGGFNIGKWVLGGAIITFLIGAFDGFTNPTACN